MRSLSLFALLFCSGLAPSFPVGPTSAAQETIAQETTDSTTDQTVEQQSLHGKVMVGYQGWFNCPGDGSKLGWKHWSRHPHEPLEPGNITIDLWPDVSELNDDEKHTTGFQHADGSQAEVFSSAHPKTVERHFRWMKEYGIDGAFLQRFAVGLRGENSLKNNDKILDNVRHATQQASRCYAVMYDLSGLKAGEVKIVRDDWSRLRSTLKVTEDDSYLLHDGQPVVAVWGIGFSDDRQYTLDECRELVEWLKSTGCCVMLGVPSYWRELNRDAVADPLLHDILRQADIVSPWSVGRYTSPRDARAHGRNVWQPDKRWCDEAGIDFLPVVFPGFSWHNLHGNKLNEIPRRRGRFFWSQAQAAKLANCDMIYIAMFDEVDEGTAIFKCTNSPPELNGGRFSTFEGLPSDFYLRLAGRAGRMLRGEPLQGD